ncbi:MAG: PaaI family thioesterase [candidate division Zixibacteria bacterium]|nr:PaaI family thioesterase [candidate division Zixibacteria bacterium]
MKKLSKEVERGLFKVFSRVPLLRHFKLKLQAVRPGCARITVRFAPHLAQVHGFMHGGVVATIADTAATYASNTLLFPERETITVELKINYVAPVKTKTAVAEAVVLHSGNKTSISEVKVFDSKKKLCAVVLITNLILPRGEIRTQPRKEG